ncbi:MAG: hypothetical protein M4579_005499 [Chaenotheca gracillima]|nr:MAG: hypothetical protein M4579_005499 [Chaenotheca gracillima]
MTAIYVAYTAPINPPSASPVLTVDELWEGAIHKCHEPEKYIFPIAYCRVERQDENGMTRVIKFREGFGDPNEEVVEEIVYSKPMKVDFATPSTGALVENIVSYGPSLEETDLHLTFTFKWPFNGTAAEETAARAKYLQMAKGGVEGTIAAIRKEKLEKKEAQV